MLAHRIVPNASLFFSSKIFNLGLNNFIAGNTRVPARNFFLNDHHDGLIRITFISNHDESYSRRIILFPREHLQILILSLRLDNKIDNKINSS